MRRRLQYEAITATAGILMLFAGGPAEAQTPRNLCPDRPGLGTPPCTLEPGRIMIETGLIDWTRDQDDDARTDTFAAGATVLRMGLADHVEVQIGWNGYGHLTERDRLMNRKSKISGSGDILLAANRNLRNPDGSGLSISLYPYVTLPTGGQALGAGDWGAGLIVPLSFDLGGSVALALSPHIDAAVDEDRSGRHLAYGSVIGIDIDLSDRLSGTAEFSVSRDHDPGGHSTELLAGFALAWQSGENRQVDIGLNIGLDRDSPDSQLYLGFVQRF